MVEEGDQVYGFDWKTLPDGYGLAIVPGDAVLKPLHGNDFGPLFPATPLRNMGRAVVALFQGLYATFTVVRSAQGDELEKYGYAAFSLTVLPYALMSAVNTFSNLLCPTFDSLYLVSSSISEEASKRPTGYQSFAQGAIAKLAELESCQEDRDAKDRVQHNEETGHENGEDDEDILKRLIASNYLGASTLDRESRSEYEVYHLTRLLWLLPGRRLRPHKVCKINCDKDLKIVPRGAAGSEPPVPEPTNLDDIKKQNLELSIELHHQSKELENGVWKFIKETRGMTKILVPRCHRFERKSQTKIPRVWMLV
jgi:hypothetical protein